jgi:hypothetical protein
MLALALAVALPALALAAQDPRLEPEQIRMVQRALGANGQQVALSGTWDEETGAALERFQSAHGLPATGTFDRDTSRALGLDPSAVRPVSGRLPAADPAVNCAINNTVDCLPGP